MRSIWVHWEPDGRSSSCCDITQSLSNSQHTHSNHHTANNQLICMYLLHFDNQAWGCAAQDGVTHQDHMAVCVHYTQWAHVQASLLMATLTMLEGLRFGGRKLNWSLGGEECSANSILALHSTNSDNRTAQSFKRKASVFSLHCLWYSCANVTINVSSESIVSMYRCAGKYVPCTHAHKHTHTLHSVLDKVKGYLPRADTLSRLYSITGPLRMWTRSSSVLMCTADTFFSMPFKGCSISDSSACTHTHTHIHTYICMHIPTYEYTGKQQQMDLHSTDSISRWL